MDALRHLGVFNHVGLHRHLPQELCDAIGNRLKGSFLRLSLPADADSAAAFRVAIETQAFRDKFAEATGQCQAAPLADYLPDDGIALLDARRQSSEAVALASPVTRYGSRAASLQRTRGQRPGSSPPHITHQGLWHGQTATTRAGRWLRATAWQPTRACVHAPKNDGHLALSRHHR